MIEKDNKEKQISNMETRADEINREVEIYANSDKQWNEIKAKLEIAKTALRYITITLSPRYTLVEVAANALEAIGEDDE